MLKKKIDYDKAAKMLFSRTEHYADNVRRLYATATDELLKLSAMKASNGVSAAFSFSDSKRLSEQANTILRALYSGVYNEIKGGVIAEWENANKSCDALITSIFGKKVKEDNHYARFFARNKESVDAFFKRKSEYGGLNLSQRVWKYVGDFKTEMEMALSVAMGEGKSAATISREVRKYLQRPDMMFRRFRVKTGEQDIFDADGNVVGKEPVYGRVWKRKVVDAVTGNVSWQTVNLKDYSFGRGVYRSSYKNAMRLARTETNMAYRTADQERWRQLDFVIGYRVVLSDNHPEPDICNDLSAKRGEKGSRGVYPKDFVFKGWHPQCRCYVVPILADEKEFDKIQEAILNDEPIPESKSVIREPNKYFQDWWKKNKKRVSEAQSLPYWVKDNPKYTKIKREKTDAEKSLEKAIKDVVIKARSSGGEVQGLAESIAAGHNAICTPINYKSEASIKRKVLSRRIKDDSFMPENLTDCVRTTIIVDTRQLKYVINELKAQESFYKYKPQKTILGYVGNIVNVKTNNGLVAEIQVNTAKMIYAKELPENAKAILGEKLWNKIHRETGIEGGLGHKYYEEWRVMSKEEQQSAKGIALRKRSEEYYSHFNK
nr:MAG TPA: minor capsid protein [Caudoviricetes sp.]